MKRGLTLISIFCYVLNVAAQNDTIWVNEVEISALRTPAIYSESSRIINVITKNEIQSAPVQSITELLEYAMNVDVRQRGYNGIQSDISIRGGTFDQTLILINGIPFNDPQSGHHNSDLPIELDNIEQIEILEGPASRIFGPNAFCGAINIITGSSNENKVKVDLTAGQHELFSAGISGNYSSKKYAGNLSYSKKGSGGYIENTDYKITGLHHQSAINLKKSKLDFQLAYQDKAFGANSFYTPAYPNQFEQTKTQFGSIKYSGGNKLKYSYALYYKRHNDRFELFRQYPASWYSGHNYHQTDVWGVEANSYFISKFGRTAFGYSFRDEAVVSNVLGLVMDEPILVAGEEDIFYTKSDQRTNISVFAEQAYYSKRINVAAGIMANYHSVYGLKWFPGIDASYLISNNLKWFVSINKSYRLPTFTDLYYVGPTNIGNSDIQPEEATTYETGVKFQTNDVITEIAIFKRNGKNIIDWVRVADTLKWESKNITRLNTVGVEASVVISASFFEKMNLPINQIRLSYAYIDITKQSANFISKYALDHLASKFSFNITHNIVNNIGMNWHLNIQDRAGSYMDYASGAETEYAPFTLLDAKIYYHLKSWKFYVEASNIFNVDYYDIGNLIMPGRWIRIGISSTLKFKK